MMQKHVPLSKQSKRKRKEHYAAQRRDWGSIDPVTKIKPNGKAYKRSKSGLRYEYEPSPGFSNMRICLNLWNHFDINYEYNFRYKDSICK